MEVGRGFRLALLTGPTTQGMALPSNGCPSRRTNKLDLIGEKEGLESTNSLNIRSEVSALKLHEGSDDLEIIREEDSLAVPCLNY